MTATLDRTAPPAADPQLAMLVEAMATLSRMHDPQATFELFFDAMRKRWGVKGYVGLMCDSENPGHYRILRHQDQTGRDLRPPLEFNDPTPVATCDQGWLGDICRDGIPRWFNNLSIGDDPVMHTALADYRSAMVAPIYEHGRVRRWAILFDDHPATFTGDMLEQFVLHANLVSTVVQNLRNAQLLQQAHRQINLEVERIAEIQKALLPSALPAIPGLQIATSYQTFDRAGGDLYSFQHLGRPEVHCNSPEDPDAPWAIFIGDVSGHGPAAAVVMAMVNALIGAFPQRPERPSQILAHLNQHLAAKQIDASFVTAFLAFYDPASRRLTYSAAGHPPPLWRRPRTGGGIDIRALDDVLGFPLGILCDADYDNAEITLAPGQTLALFTDGITEARGVEGNFYGSAGVTAALRHCSGEASCLVDTLTRELKAFEQGGRPHDDQTIVAVEVI